MISFRHDEENERSRNEAPSLREKSIKIALVVILYWFCSITLVFLNKYLLSSAEMKLDAPLFITWFQCLVSFVLSYIAVAYQHRNKNSKLGDVFEMSKAQQILPLSIVFVLMITANNLCLKYVSVAFYYIGRSTTIVFNVILSYVMLKQTSSLKVLGCCAVIVGGFLLGVIQENTESSFSLIGVIFGVLSSLFVALNAIYTKKKLPVVSEDIWRLAMYNNANAVLLFLPFMLIFGEVQELFKFMLSMVLKPWLLLCLSGVFGFAISYVTILQVKVTSALTHNISATAKSAFQTVLAVIVYTEKKDVLWWASNVIVLVASMAYSHVRHTEMRQSSNTPTQH